MMYLCEYPRKINCQSRNNSVRQAEPEKLKSFVFTLIQLKNKNKSKIKFLRRFFAQNKLRNLQTRFDHEKVI